MHYFIKVLLIGISIFYIYKLKQKMKNKIKDSNNHGIISTIQSPEKGSNKTVDEKCLKNVNEEPEHGIISVVQAPNSATNKEKKKRDK
jgi:hypothetical protein